MANKKKLLANCIIPNRRLEKDLISYLKTHRIPNFLELIQVEGISCPLRLRGSISNLIVVDSSKRLFELSLAKTCYTLTKFDDQKEIRLLIDLDDFSVKTYKIILTDGSFEIFIDARSLCAEVSAYSKDTLSISFDETVSIPDIISEKMLKLCVNTQKHYLRFNKFNLEDIKTQLFSILGDKYAVSIY